MCSLRSLNVMSFSQKIMSLPRIACGIMPSLVGIVTVKSLKSQKTLVPLNMSSSSILLLYVGKVPPAPTASFVSLGRSISKT